MDSTGRAAGWGEILAPQHLAALVLVCLGPWLHAADALLVTTMMPAIVAGIGGERLVAWNFALYEVGSIVAGASAGLVALRYGLRLPMVAAAAAFALGCAVSAAAPVMEVLLAGRIAQGLGGGGLVSLSFVAVARLFPGPLMPRAMAALALVWGASAFLGPLAGGLFVTHANWRWGFVFFGAQAAGLAVWIGYGLRRLPSAGAAWEETRLPWRRLALLSLAVLGVATAGIVVSVPAMVSSLIAGLAALAAFAVLDGRAGVDRLWPAGALDPRGAAGAGIVMVMMTSAATMGLSAYGPLLMDRIHGTSPLVAGYIVAVISIAWTVAAVLVAGLPERHDPLVIGAGIAMVAASVAVAVYAMPEGPLWLIALGAGMEGFGFGMAWTFILRRGETLVDPADHDRFAATVPTASRLGYALGASFVGILANRAGFGAGSAPEEAAHVARAIFGGSLPIAALAVLAMARFVTFRR
ncbi:MAG: MFS transporter [Rhodobacteraceae bacterium]|nr:MFS transporter [Paracoccaceae bacterium]